MRVLGRVPGEVFTASNIGNTVTNVYKRGRRRNYRKRTVNLITASSYIAGSFGFQLTCQCPKTLVRDFPAFCICSSGSTLQGQLCPGWRDQLCSSSFFKTYFRCHSSPHPGAEPASCYVLYGFDTAQMGAVALVLSFGGRAGRVHVHSFHPPCIWISCQLVLG